MEQFIGRKWELSRLEQIYTDRSNRTCAVYGRRRIGKTALLRQFCQHKKALFFPCLSGSEIENLLMFRHTIEDYLQKDLPDFTSFQEVLRTLSRICRKEKTVIVIDELPALTSVSKAFPAMLQHFIDGELADSESMLIVCGSSIGAMRTELEADDKPLFGRFINRLEVGPLSYRLCRQFHPSMNDLEALKVYLTVGGVPLYHLLMDSDTYENCIERNFLGIQARLGEETDGLIERELSPSDRYSALLSGLADGLARPVDLAGRLKLDEGLCNRSLTDLETLGLIERIEPMGRSPKKPNYRIKDPLVAFDYQVIRPRQALALSGGPAAYRALEPAIETFFGHRFEEVCAEYVREHYTVRKIGRWWYQRGDFSAELDLVADVLIDGHEETLIGECKFRHSPPGLETLELLEQRAKLTDFPNQKLIIFSAYGFRPELTEEAADGRVTLIGLGKLMSE